MGVYSDFLGIQNFKFQYFWGVFRKMNIFWHMNILLKFFIDNHKAGLVLGVISMRFMVSFPYRMVIFFRGC